MDSRERISPQSSDARRVVRRLRNATVRRCRLRLAKLASNSAVHAEPAGNARVVASDASLCGARDGVGRRHAHRRSGQRAWEPEGSGREKPEHSSRARRVRDGTRWRSSPRCGHSRAAKEPSASQFFVSNACWPAELRGGFRHTHCGQRMRLAAACGGCAELRRCRWQRRRANAVLHLQQAAVAEVARDGCGALVRPLLRWVCCSGGGGRAGCRRAAERSTRRRTTR